MPYWNSTATNKPNWRVRKRNCTLRKTPAVTQDGVEITLLANIELPEDAAHALDAGASGVGLFRSEFYLWSAADRTPFADGGRTV
jgi:phosphotransferase system enzyme I (PtsI)